MTYKRTFYSSVLKMGTYTIANAAISFFSSVITARVLSPEEFGTIALITVFSGFIAFFKDSGITYIIIREQHTEQQLNELHFFSVTIGSVLTLISLALAYPIALFYNSNKLILPAGLVSITLLLESFSITPTALLRKQLRFNEMGLSQLIALIIGLGAVIVFALLGFSYWSIIYGQWITAVVKFLYLQQKCPLKFGFLNLQELKTIFVRTKKMMINISSSRLITYWSSNADNLLVGKILGAFSLGIYARAYQLLTLQMNVISSTFNSTLLPNIVKVSREKFGSEYSEAVNVMIMITFPVMITLVFFPDFFVSILWGEQWTSVARIAPYFGVMALLYLPMSTLGTLFIATNHEHLLFSLGWITSIATILLIVLGIMFSLEWMVFSISAGHALIIVPINLFYAVKKVKVFSLRDITVHWFPKIIFCLALIIGIHYSVFYLKLVTSILFFLYLVFMTRHLLFKLADKLKYSVTSQNAV